MTCSSVTATSSTRPTAVMVWPTWRSSGGRSPPSGRTSNPASAVKSVDVKGLYVTPGLVDLHVHVYAGTGERRSYAGDNSVYPDGFTFRSGVTTVVDAGCSGWRNFEDFKAKVIDRSKTRVLALINIVGNGMRGSRFEQDVTDMEARADRCDGHQAQGCHRRNQDRALPGHQLHRGRPGRRGRDRSRHPRHGRLRPGRASEVARGAVDEEASPRRHLHPRLFRPPERADPGRARQPRFARRPQARRPV